MFDVPYIRFVVTGCNNHTDSLVAEGVGFEPTELMLTGIRDRLLRPLGHPSIIPVTVSVLPFKDKVAFDVRTIFGQLSARHFQNLHARRTVPGVCDFSLSKTILRYTSEKIPFLHMADRYGRSSRVRTCTHGFGDRRSASLSYTPIWQRFFTTWDTSLRGVLRFPYSASHVCRPQQRIGSSALPYGVHPRLRGVNSPTFFAYCFLLLATG